MSHGNNNSIVFLVETGAIDLGLTRCAGINWVYKGDLMDPRSYCLWGCNSGLYLTSISVSNASNVDMFRQVERRG